MSRRDRIDPETARLVEERLQWLLTSTGPSPYRRRPVPGRAGANPARNRDVPERIRRTDDPNRGPVRLDDESCRTRSR